MPYLVSVVERRRDGGGEFSLTWASWESEPQSVYSYTGIIANVARLVKIERTEIKRYRNAAERALIVKEIRAAQKL